MSRWVERVRYSEGFLNEEEARRWLEQMEAEMRAFHQRLMRMTELFLPFDMQPSYVAKPKPEDLISRIEAVEKELGEIKRLVTRKYGVSRSEIR